MAGIANLPRMSPYSVTKAAVISLTETLAHEVSKTQVRVLCVMPTFFQSDIMQHSRGIAKTVENAKKIVSTTKLTSKEAAYIILSGLHKNKETLRFPFSEQMFFYGRRLFPYIYKKVIRKVLLK